MTVRVSSRFKELILGPNSFSSIFNGGRILIYTGPQPSSADYPVTGTLLAQVTAEGASWVPNGGPGGLDFVETGVWASKDPAQTWQLVASAAGTAGWFRLVGKDPADTGDYSFTAPRIDGIVGAGGAVDLKLPNTALTIGYMLPIQQFLFSFPPAL